MMSTSLKMIVIFIFSFQIQSLFGQGNNSPSGHKSIEKAGVYIQNSIVYPKMAIQYNITGKVVYKFKITPEGCIDSISIVSSSHELLGNAVMAAIKKNKCGWEPYQKNNIPVDKWIQTFAVFSLIPN